MEEEGGRQFFCFFLIGDNFKTRFIGPPSLRNNKKPWSCKRTKKIRPRSDGDGGGGKKWADRGKEVEKVQHKWSERHHRSKVVLVFSRELPLFQTRLSCRKLKCQEQWNLKSSDSSNSSLRVSLTRYTWWELVRLVVKKRTLTLLSSASKKPCT